MNEGRHDLNRIEHVGRELVLVCECGWRSVPTPDAARLGVAWDEHRQGGRA